MFNLNSKIDRLTLKSSEVVAVISSGNRPNVSVAGPAQKADAYIISTKEGKKRSIYICFHLIVEDKRLFFTSDRCPTADSNISAIETDAISFVEDLGFVMVRKNILDEYTGDVRDDFIMTLIPFAEDLKKIRKREEGEEVKKEATGSVSEDDEDEYEEVMEEVYEEVPVDDEDDLDQAEAFEVGENEQEMEYENLDDIVTDDGYEWGGKPSESGDLKRVDEKIERSGDVEKEMEKKREVDYRRKSALEDESSEAVESFKNNVSDPKVPEKVSDESKVVASKTGSGGKESKFFVDEGQRHLVRLLISL